MKDITVIFVLLTSYMILMTVITVINKSRPGIVLYNHLRQNNLSLLNWLHITSTMVMMLPVATIKHLPIFILSFPDKTSVPQTITFLFCFGIIGLFPWQKFSNPQNKNIAVSPVYSIASYICYRVIFLAAYEWFFRGLLLISFCEWFGLTWGIAINVILYVIIHNAKSKREIIGCIPLGILLCAFTIWWQSIWPAIIFHVQIAFVNEWPQLKQFLSPKKQTVL